jgi:hypothetical protein
VAGQGLDKMADLTFGLGVVGLVLVGIVLIGIAVMMKGLTRNTKSALMAVGVIALAFSVISVALPSLGNVDNAQITENVTFDVSASESMAHVTYNDATNTFLMACVWDSGDSAFANNTQYFEATFDIAWATGPAGQDGIARAALGSVGMVDVEGAANEYIVDQNADKSFKALWTKSSSVTAYESINTLVQYGMEGQVTLNVTLNADAMAEMDQYEQTSFGFTVGGHSYTVNVMKATVQA